MVGAIHPNRVDGESGSKILCPQSQTQDSQNNAKGTDSERYQTEAHGSSNLKRAPTTQMKRRSFIIKALCSIAATLATCFVWIRPKPKKERKTQGTTLFLKAEEYIVSPQEWDKLPEESLRYVVCHLNGQSWHLDMQSLNGIADPCYMVFDMETGVIETRLLIA